MADFRKETICCTMISFILCMVMAGYILSMRLAYGDGILYADGVSVNYDDVNRSILYELLGAAIVCYLPALVIEKMKYGKEVFVPLFDDIFSSMAVNLIVDPLLLITVAERAVSYVGWVLYSGSQPVLIGGSAYHYTVDMWVLGIGSLLLFAVGIFFVIKIKRSCPERKGLLWIFRQ